MQSITPQIQTKAPVVTRNNTRPIEAVEVSRNYHPGKGLNQRKRAKVIEVEIQFRLKIADAQSVSVAGTFNEWDAKRMQLERNGAEWVGALKLPRGCYEYRFVVDGTWLTDPTATESVPNAFGGFNSVLTV